MKIHKRLIDLHSSSEIVKQIVSYSTRKTSTKFAESVLDFHLP